MNIGLKSKPRMAIFIIERQEMMALMEVPT